MSVAAVLFVCWPLDVAAQRPSATLLGTQRDGAELEVSQIFEQALREQLGEFDNLRITNEVELDIEQLQLALGCAGEPSECFSTVAATAQTDLVIVPSLALEEGALRATVSMFDARDGSQTRAVRSAESISQVVDQLDGMVRELLGLAAPAPLASAESGERLETRAGQSSEAPLSQPQVPHAQPSGSTDENGEDPSLVANQHAPSPWPIALAAGGGAVLVGGIVLSVLASDDFGAYADARPLDRSSVDNAYSTLERARSEATAATALYVIGALCVAGGLSWVLAAGNEDGSSPLAVSGSLSSTHLALELRGSWGARTW